MLVRNETKTKSYMYIEFVFFIYLLILNYCIHLKFVKIKKMLAHIN